MTLDPAEIQEEAAAARDPRNRALYRAQAILSRIGVPADSKIQYLHAEQITAFIEKLDDEIEKAEARLMTSRNPTDGHLISLLNNRRLRLRERAAYLEQQQQLAAIQGAVDSSVEDPHAREVLSEKVEALRHQLEEIQTARETESRETRQLKTFASKWQVRKEMLQREPAAVMVGAILLLGMALSFIVAMFISIEVPQILASGFLLVLGFFFGQNSDRGKSSGNDES